MTWLGLVSTGLWRKPTRTVLTALSLTVAFVLFMLLRALSAAFTGGASLPGVHRLLVDAKYAMTDNLPLAAVQTVRAIPGVAEGSNAQMSWFGGYYQDPAHAFAKAPVDHTRYFRIFPELVIADDVLARFQTSRRAVVVPDAMADEYGWRTGDLVPIVGDIWPKSDGSWDWEFEGRGDLPGASRERPPAVVPAPLRLLQRVGRSLGEESGRLGRGSRRRRRRSAGGRRRHRSPLRELVRPDTFPVRRRTEPAAREPAWRHRPHRDADPRRRLLHDAPADGERRRPGVSRARAGAGRHEGPGIQGRHRRRRGARRGAGALPRRRRGRGRESGSRSSCR